MATDPSSQERIVEQWNADEAELAKWSPVERLERIFERMSEANQRISHLADIRARTMDELRTQHGVTGTAEMAGLSRQAVHRALSAFDNTPRTVLAASTTSGSVAPSVQFGVPSGRFVRFELSCHRLYGDVALVVDGTERAQFSTAVELTDPKMPFYGFVDEGHHTAEFTPAAGARIEGPLELRVIDETEPDAIPRPTVGDIVGRGRQGV